MSHFDYRIDIHDRFDRESRHVCHSVTTTSQSEEIVRSQHPGELKNIKSAYRLDGKKFP